MSKDVKFNIKLSIDGKEHLVEATTDVKKFADELGITATKTKVLQESLLFFNHATQAIQNVSSSLQQLTGLMQQYTAAFAVQQEAETKLANNMRNTMGAREEDIQSIKNLCAAQQQLGVIGDEVQLAGAQQLATFLSQKSSLEALIPVMNDMIAKEGGLKASQSDAESAASLLGKALNGTTTMLERAGYFLNDAQKQILQFGTEEQKVAVLTEVIEAKVGGMNQALAKTDAGKAKQAANNFGDAKERIGELFASIEPTIIAAGQLGLALNAVSITATSIASVTKAIKALMLTINGAKIAAIAHNAVTKVGAVIQALWAKQMYYGKMANIAWAFSAKRAIVQAYAMRAAIVGLMAVTGIGLAIAAVSAIVSLFASNMDDAADSTANLSEEAKHAKEIADENKERTDAESQAYTSAASSLNLYKTRLEDLISKKKQGFDVSKDEKKIVGELNNAYGETMGYFASVSAWYDALIANSEAYCRQMVLEAKTRTLANQIAAKESERDKVQESIDSGGLSTERQREAVYMGTTTAGTPMYANIGDEIAGTSALDKAQTRVSDLTSDIEALNKDMKAAVEEAASIQFEVKGSATVPTENKPQSGNKKEGKKDLKLIENAKTYKDLTNNVSYYQQELEKCNIADTERIKTLSKQKQAAEEAVQAFKEMTESSPETLQSFDDYDKALQDLRKKRQTASFEQVAAIDSEIARIEDEREALNMQILQQSDIAKLRHEDIRTRDQLSDKTSYYNSLMAKGTEEDRKRARAGLDALDAISKKWDAVLAKSQFSLDSSGEIDVKSLNNTKDIDAAISLYTEQQKEEDADKIQQTQAIIDRLTKRRNTIQLGIELNEKQQEIDEINALSGREYRIAVKDIGFDELTSKVKELKKLLRDTENPVTDNQRKQIEGMIATYEQWRRQSISAFDTFKNGWNGIQGIGNGVQNITDALEENGNAWQKITAIINGFIAIYEGLQAVVSIIEVLTSLTAAHTVAKTAEATAIGASGVAEGANAAGQEAAAVAEIPVIAANKAATASYMELAAAMYMSAHAAIPFAGFGIGSGFATSAAAFVKGIGLMPFAKGGVVSGPTMALIGEYAGATNNPEVVAPLDKLRSMIEPSYPYGGKVRFEIDGRKLVGVLEKETNLRRRS